MSDRHGPNSWDNYQAVHQRCLKDFDHFIAEDRLVATLTRALVTWDGVLYCTDGLEIHFSRTQQVESQFGRPMVRTTEYSYHVLRRAASGPVNLFRYDNVDTQPAHPDAHHCHRFDADGNEIEPPEHIGEGSWPTLGEVIQEAHDLWH